MAKLAYSATRFGYLRLPFLVAALASSSQAQFDASFQERAMAHVRFLADLGNRVTGSEGEAKAARYVREQFEKAGLNAEIEPFEFSSFSLKEAAVIVGGATAPVRKIIFVPYAMDHRLTGEVAFVAPDAVDDGAVLTKLEVQNKLVITHEPVNPYRLQRRHPRAVAFVSARDFERLRQRKAIRGEIKVKGNTLRVRSANVVASFPPQAGSRGDIILSAHLDSVRTPGADDNASGIAALLEIARYYRDPATRPPFRLKFVAFGAEEVGMLGAKAYLNRHLDELKNCSLVLNLDTIGGAGQMHVEMRDGVQGIAGKAVNQIPQNVMDKALGDVDSMWSYIPQSSRTASDVPEWLQIALKSAGKEQGIDFLPSRDMGSDHVVFAQAGIVATNVEVSGNNIHTAEDVPEHIVPASLERAASFVVRVVRRVPAGD